MSYDTPEQELPLETRQAFAELVCSMRKIGRNDPCPCRSGLKFKKCCKPRLDARRWPKEEEPTEVEALEAAKRLCLEPWPGEAHR